MQKSTRVTATLAGLTLTFGALMAPGAHAAANAKEPCAKETTQVANAEDALARVTAVFEKQAAKVKKAKKAVVKADNRSEKAKAKRALAAAKEKKEHAKKAKKAQLQRLAKAQTRLADCQAKQAPVETPAA